MEPSTGATSDAEFEQLLAAASHATAKSPRLGIEPSETDLAHENKQEKKDVRSQRDKAQ